jgi:hypothetical protein
MTDTIKNIDFYYFTYHIVSDFAKILDNTCIGYYEKLDDEWWYKQATIFIPLIDKGGDEEIDTKLVDAVIGKLGITLTDELKQSLFETILMSIYRFINRNNQNTVCYCGDEGCDGTCGVLSCGCIDSCKCDYSECYSD